MTLLSINPESIPYHYFTDKTNNFNLLKNKWWCRKLPAFLQKFQPLISIEFSYRMFETLQTFWNTRNYTTAIIHILRPFPQIFRLFLYKMNLMSPKAQTLLLYKSKLEPLLRETSFRYKLSRCWNSKNTNSNVQIAEVKNSFWFIKEHSFEHVVSWTFKEKCF